MNDIHNSNLREKPGKIFSFSLKIALIFSFATLFISVTILYFFYVYSKENILNSIQNRIKNVGQMSLFLLKQKNYKNIEEIDKLLEQKINQLSEEELQELLKTPEGETYDILTEEEHEEIYKKKEVQDIVQILRKIKAGSTPRPILQDYYSIKFYTDDNKPFYRFIYILTPIQKFKEHNFVKFILDSDMEEFDTNNNGKIDIDEETLLIGAIWNIKDLVYLKDTLKTKEIQCEKDFYQDQWGMWLSCYIPLKDYNQKFIGILGLDLDVKSEYNKLGKLRYILYTLLIFLLSGTFLLSFISAKLFLKPVMELSKASIEVANKNFNIELPVRTRDEVGILTRNFNLMIKEIKEYSEHLEDLVKQRTLELQQTLEKVQKLKNQQDGDYYLTSLLLDPLIKNLNKSVNVITEFFIKQKKDFIFKEKKKDIGGDLCITGNLRFLNKEKKIERWIFFFNGDAMGKSTQGAGGSLVMGSLLNAILSRSAAKNKILTTNPLKWFKEVCFELQNVFSKFDGFMLVSGAMGILNEYTGELVYGNFEHPKTILYRNHTASFLEEDDILNYKFGFPNVKKLKVIHTILEEDDILILGSDGRDDIILKESNQLNTNENLILKIVENSLGNLTKIYEEITNIGTLTDDISLLKVHFLNKVDIKKIIEIEENIKELFFSKEYEEIINNSKNVKNIMNPMVYYYISYSYYKMNDVIKAKEFLDPIQNFINNTNFDKFKKHILVKWEKLVDSNM